MIGGLWQTGTGVARRWRARPGRIVTGLAVVALTVGGFWPGMARQAGAASAKVTMVGTQFVPISVSIKTGDSVVWENREPANYPVVMSVHNVVSDDGAFASSPPINPGESWSRTFTRPGTFKYHCGIHPTQMKGTVNVSGDAVPEPAATAPSPTGAGGTVVTKGGERVRRVELTISEKDFPVLGVPMTWWTYGGTVPGTTIRANVGDTLEIVLKNTHNLPHAIHTHFMDYDISDDGSSMTAPLPVVPHQEDDIVGAAGGMVPGVAGNKGPAIGQNPIGPYDARGDRDVAGPGQSYTYRWKLTEAGTSWYHCHVLEATDHISKGLYGFIIVYPKGWTWEELPPDPRNGNTKAWVKNDAGERLFEDLIIIGERNLSPGAALPTDSTIGLAGGGGVLGGPIHVGNGRAWNDPYVVGPVRSGQKILLHVGDIGESPHSWHVHGHHMTRMQQFDPEGTHMRGFFTRPLEHMHNLGLMPGDIFPTMITAGRPGFWFEHDHVVPNAYLGMVPWLHVLPAATEASAAGGSAKKAEVSIVEPSADDPNSWAFQPGDVSIATGGTVTWKDAGKQDHDVTSAEGAPESFRSGTLKPGATWSRTFDAAGDYSYYCSIHSWMKGTIHVGSGKAPASTAAARQATGTRGGSAAAAPAASKPAASTKQAAPARASVSALEGSAADPQSWGFDPGAVTVGKGATVTWTNGGAQIHNVVSTADPKAFGSPNLKPGERYRHRFGSIGTYAYQCTLHPWMKGTVKVVAAGTAVEPASVKQVTGPGTQAAAPPASQPEGAGGSTLGGLLPTAATGSGLGGPLIALVVLGMITAGAVFTTVIAYRRLRVPKA